jgi:hypothetical protein
MDSYLSLSLTVLQFAAYIKTLPVPFGRVNMIVCAFILHNMKELNYEIFRSAMGACFYSTS